MNGPEGANGSALVGLVLLCSAVLDALDRNTSFSSALKSITPEVAAPQPPPPVAAGDLLLLALLLLLIMFFADWGILNFLRGNEVKNENLSEWQNVAKNNQCVEHTFWAGLHCPSSPWVAD